MKNNKKAFTIVELVIVIAVIAILAAVLIPTFSSLIEKANINSDTAAVKQMNTYLSADEQINGKAGSWQDAVKVLSKSNLDAQNYKALSADHYLVYDSSLNRVLYVRAEDKAVIYPEEYADVKGSLEEFGTWTTLEGQMVADDSWRNKTQDLTSSFGQEGNFSFSYGDVAVLGKDNTELKDSLTANEGELADKIGYTEYFGKDDVSANLAALSFKNDASIKSGQATFGEYTISKLDTADKLTDFAEYIENNNYGKNHALIITDDLDLRSAEWKPLNNYYGSLDGKLSDGQSAVISNLKMTDATAEVALYIGDESDGGNTYYGFVSVFSGNYFGNVTFENVEAVKPGLSNTDTLYSSANIRPDGHMTAAVIGCVSNIDRIDMVIENVKVESGYVHGLSRAAGLFGVVGLTKINNKSEYLTKGTITIRNCVNKATVNTDASISGGYGDAGGIIGRTHRMQKGSSLIIENCENYGNITGTLAGGIIGVSSGSNNVLLDCCVNKGKVTAEHKTVTFPGEPQCSAIVAGGLIGTNSATIQIYDNCKNEGEVITSNPNNATLKFEFANDIIGARDAGNSKYKEHENAIVATPSK